MVSNYLLCFPNKLKNKFPSYFQNGIKRFYRVFKLKFLGNVFPLRFSLFPRISDFKIENGPCTKFPCNLANRNQSQAIRLKL